MSAADIAAMSLGGSGSGGSRALSVEALATLRRIQQLRAGAALDVSDITRRVGVPLSPHRELLRPSSGGTSSGALTGAHASHPAPALAPAPAPAPPKVNTAASARALLLASGSGTSGSGRSSGGGAGSNGSIGSLTAPPLQPATTTAAVTVVPPSSPGASVGSMDAGVSPASSAQAVSAAYTPPPKLPHLEVSGAHVATAPAMDGVALLAGGVPLSPGTAARAFAAVVRPYTGTIESPGGDVTAAARDAGFPPSTTTSDAGG